MLRDDYPRTAAALAVLIGSSWRPLGHTVQITRAGFSLRFLWIEVRDQEHPGRSGMSILDAATAEEFDDPEICAGYVTGCAESALRRLRKSLAGPFAE